MERTTSLINHDSQNLIANTHDDYIKVSAPPVFLLCDRCYWCATYFNNARIPTENNICPQCNAMQSTIN